MQHTFSPLTSMVAPSSLEAVRRVAMKPYAMALQRMLNAPHSRATVFVRPTTPAFACGHACIMNPGQMYKGALLIASHRQPSCMIQTIGTAPQMQQDVTVL